MKCVCYVSFVWLTMNFWGWEPMLWIGANMLVYTASERALFGKSRWNAVKETKFRFVKISNHFIKINYVNSGSSITI